MAKAATATKQQPRRRLPTTPPIPKLKAWILRRRTTQKLVGIAAGIGETRMSDIVRGRAVATRDDMRRIAAVLNVRVRDIFDSESDDDVDRVAS